MSVTISDLIRVIIAVIFNVSHSGDEHFVKENFNLSRRKLGRQRVRIFYTNFSIEKLCFFAVIVSFVAR